MTVRYQIHERTTVNSEQSTSLLMRNGILGAFVIQRMLLRARAEGVEDYDAIAQLHISLIDEDDIGTSPLLSSEASSVIFNYEAIPPPRLTEDEEEEFDPTLWMIPYVLPPERALRLLIRAREFPAEIKGRITFYAILDGYKDIEP